MQVRAYMQLKEGIWICCNGLVQTVAHGMEKLAQLQQEEDIWKYFSGLMRMGVRGTKKPA